MESLDVSIRVEELRWGEKIKETIFKDGEPFDYIVASDVIWLDYLVEPLVETITNIMTMTTTTPTREESNDLKTDGHINSMSDKEMEDTRRVEERRPSSRRTELILGHETRSKRVEDRFFELLQQRGFEVNKVEWEKMHVNYRSKDINIYRIRLP